MAEGRKKRLNALLAMVILIAAVGAAVVLMRSGGASASAPPKPQESTAPVAREPDTLDLSVLPPTGVKIAAVEEREFRIEARTLGSIQFNQEMAVDVFAPYPGRIISLNATIGDDIAKGQTLFTIDSPDLLQAQSTLIAAAGTLELTTRNLSRMRDLSSSRAISQKDLDQAISDHQAAQGALSAARNAVRLFGKTDAELDRIVAQRAADSTLVVPSPISGRITARNGAPGLYVQPANGQAPYSIADVSTMWMTANVIEIDSPAIKVGQPVKVDVAAFPNRTFEGRVVKVGSIVDPTTRRVQVRSEVADPRRELRAGMFATFAIQTGEPVRSPAVPVNGVVREGNGTMAVWVTTDRRKFTRRAVTAGLEQDGFRQIVDGVAPGELVVTEGALFLSNALATAAQ